MVVRHRKRSRHRYMATRKWGRGNIKHGRGKGSRGGSGFAGSSKHKWIWIIKNHPDHFGKESMKSMKAVKQKTINLWALNQMALNGKLSKGSDGKFKAEFKGFKVLGAGKLEFPLHVEADAFSEGAVRKIKAAGGETKGEIVKAKPAVAPTPAPGKKAK